MSEEHTDNLARARLIEQRRAFVKVLAGPYERGKTEQAREKFLEMQTVIEVMNRAIEDEERSQGSVPILDWTGVTDHEGTHQRVAKFLSEIKD
jgi:hypothetical protein